MNKFESLGLSAETLTTLERKGFKEPTQIQSLAIPLLLENRVDIIAQAQTGTGKTAVFALPLIEDLDPKRKKVQALVLTPTRELAIQVSQEIESLGGRSGVKTAVIYGGQGIEKQIKRLREGVSIVVGTPGRIQDHLRRGTLVLDRIRYFILDEADEMLNMGFIEDIETIMENTPTEKRVLLFSATMPKQIRKLAENYMGEYNHVRAEPELTTDLTEQIYFEVRRKEKYQALKRILLLERDLYGIIFCKTKADVDDLTKKLHQDGFKVDNLHGDISQPLREKILRKFRTRKVNIMVATDVAARGIDVEDVTHVINYSMPNNAEMYVHRIGRTGRAGRKGTAITFVTPAELKRMKFIKKFTRAEIEKKRMPGDREIVGMRKEKVKGDLDRMMEHGETEGYRQWAREMLEERSGEDLVTALMKYAFGKDLEHRSGPKKSVEGSLKENRKSTHGKPDVRMTRLSIALGGRDNVDVKMIRELISSKAGKLSGSIRETDIRSDHTIISVPSGDAKSILKFFRRTKKDGKPLIRKLENDRSRKKGSKRFQKPKNRPVRP